jgi:hypothetical protein
MILATSQLDKVILTFVAFVQPLLLENVIFEAAYSDSKQTTPESIKEHMGLLRGGAVWGNFFFLINPTRPLMNESHIIASTCYYF